MQVVSLSPLTVGSVLWQSRAGAWTFTFVCKATYALEPMECRLAEEQESPNEDDRPWSEDIQSLYAPSDLAPQKARADVVLIGNAFAARPSRSITARLVVGEVDKSIELFCDRTFTQEGALEEGAPFQRMALIYERAAGGPQTQNPVGMRLDRRDAYGRLALPNLQPPGVHVTSPSHHIPPIGFGPIAATWPERLEKLGRHTTWSAYDLSRGPIPEGIDPGYFNCAPRDQQMAAIRENEPVVLEHLHPEHRRLVTSLPGIRPRAFLDSRRGDPQGLLTMRADTLWIDTVRSLCTLTWRGQVGLSRRDEADRVLIAMEKPQQKLGWADLERLSPSPVQILRADDLVEATGVVDLEGTVTNVNADRARALPFLPAPSAPARREEKAPGASANPLPFRATMMGMVSPFAPQQMASPPVASPPIVAPIAAPPIAAPIAAPPIAAPPIAAPIPAPPIAAPIPAPPIASSVALPPPVAPPPRPPADSSPWAVGAIAAAPAAAWLAPPVAALPAAAPLPAPTGPRPAVRLEPREVLRLIWYDAETIPRVRRVARWRQIWKELADRPIDRDLDDAAPSQDPMELEDRREIFELLAKAELTDARGLEESLNDGIREDGKFAAPLAVVAGELEIPFDELEMLRATITTVSPLVGADEVLKANVEAAKDFLKTPDLTSSSGVAEGFTKRIEDAFAQGKRVVAPGYLETQTERVLLEKRHYQRREVLGGTHLRGLLYVPGSSAPVPSYLPDEIAKKLPLFRRYRVRALVEIDYAVDQYESYPIALRVAALVRVMPLPRR